MHICLWLCYYSRFVLFFFFFSSRRRHTRFDCDWSSDVCSSDLPASTRRRRRSGETTTAEGPKLKIQETSSNSPPTCIFMEIRPFPISRTCWEGCQTRERTYSEISELKMISTSKGSSFTTPKADSR